MAQILNYNTGPDHNVFAAEVVLSTGDKVKKDLLEGEWYFRTIVVESQYADGMLFEGLGFEPWPGF